MGRFLGSTLLALLIVGCAWALWNRDRINEDGSILTVAKSQIDQAVGYIGEAVPMSAPDSVDQRTAKLAGWKHREFGVIRIATFNVQVFGPKKSSNVVVQERLAEICSLFDVIAIQEIRSIDQTIVPKFVQRLNRDGARFDLALSPRVGRSRNREQTAFIFNRERVLLDNSFSYTINDPDDVLRREPFVGWFRALGPDPHQAFTFTLANVHLDSKRPDLELAYVDELHRIIRKDGRGEDDVILLGDFNTGDRGLEPAREKGGLTWVVSNKPTNTRNTNQYDNIVFDPRATDEFTGRAGVYDFMKQLNLTLEDALAVSDHMPVWAEFYVFESGRQQVAQETGSPARVH